MSLRRPLSNLLLRVCVALFLISTSTLAQTASSEHSPESRTIWQIGKFDEGSGEFGNTAVDYADATKDPVFRVGTGPDEDWPRFQPGPANGMAGGRLHPFTILFQMNEPPRGVYHFKVAIIYETPRLSYLKVNVNGHGG